MIPVLIKEQAYELDKDTIESGYLSQDELMDNAGKSVAQFFCEKIKNPFNLNVVVVCGKGNNGGDGVIAHSYLKKYNVSSKIVFTEKKHNHLKLIKKYKISQSDYTIYSDNTNVDKYDWIIDGIFGVGFSGKLNIKYSDLIQKINYNKNIISIDLPSGCLDAYNDNLIIDSKYTITFGYSKLSHFMNPVNNLSIVDIGFKKADKTSIFKITTDRINDILLTEPKKIKKHKKYTECNIYAGCYKYPGAAILCSMAAHKTGSGYVRLYYGDFDNENKVLLDNIKILIPEIIVESENELKNVFLNQYSPMLIGPGGTSLSCLENLTNINEYGRFVIDASAISCFDDENDVSENLCKIPDYSIMTPHVGEFKNFFQLDDICYTDIQNIQKVIQNTIIILKSFNTFIITEDMIYIMDRGPSLLATAGTGDVLSGILVSLLSQGYSRLEASILGTYLHAEAANYYMNNISKDGMTASDLINCIPQAFNKLRNND